MVSPPYGRCGFGWSPGSGSGPPPHLQRLPGRPRRGGRLRVAQAQHHGLTEHRVAERGLAEALRQLRGLRRPEPPCFAGALAGVAALRISFRRTPRRSCGGDSFALGLGAPPVEEEGGHGADVGV